MRNVEYWWSYWDVYLANRQVADIDIAASNPYGDQPTSAVLNTTKPHPMVIDIQQAIELREGAALGHSEYFIYARVDR